MTCPASFSCDGSAVFVAVATGVFGPGEADVDRGRAVVEPGTVAQIGAAAVVAIGIPNDLPRLVQFVGIAVFVAVVTGVFGPGEADVDRGRAVVEPGTLAQIGAAAVVAIGVPADLPRLVQLAGIAVFVAVVAGVFAAR